MCSSLGKAILLEYASGLLVKTISFHFLDTDLRIDSATMAGQAPSGVVNAARKSPMTTIL
jgi:hypothetical protein